MAKKTKKISITKAMITSLDGNYVIKELQKNVEEIGELTLSDIFEDFRDLSGVSISISHDSEV